MRAADRRGAYLALSDYAKATVGLSTEELLLRGCLDGRLPRALADFARIDAARVRTYAQPDGRELWSYEGKLTVQGVVFRFDCVIWYDPAREVYATEVLDIEPVDWTARVAMA